MRGRRGTTRPAELTSTACVGSFPRRTLWLTCSASQPAGWPAGCTPRVETLQLRRAGAWWDAHRRGICRPDRRCQTLALLEEAFYWRRMSGRIVWDLRMDQNSRAERNLMLSGRCALSGCRASALALVSRFQAFDHCLCRPAGLLSACTPACCARCACATPLQRYAARCCVVPARAPASGGSKGDGPPYAAALLRARGMPWRHARARSDSAAAPACTGGPNRTWLAPAPHSAAASSR